MCAIRALQSQFNAGVWDEQMDGRVDLATYPNSLHQLENMFIDPRGPISLRPGFRFIAKTKDNLKGVWLFSFITSSEEAYVIEAGQNYFRFYKNQAQILSGGVPYEIATPYSATDLPYVVVVPSADVTYLFHSQYAPRKLSHLSDTNWVLAEVNWTVPVLKEMGLKPATTLTLSAVTGSGVTATAGSSVFLNRDVGRIITSGAGRASIVSYSSGTVVAVDIIDDFSSTGPFASGEWSVLGSPIDSITPSIKSPEGAIVTITSTTSTETKTNLTPGSDYWNQSAHGTGEFYIRNTAPYYQSVKPDKMYVGGEQIIEGLIGSLGIKQWAWGNNDDLGYNTIYIRADGQDPDEKVAGYIQCGRVVQSAVFRTEDVGKYILIHSGLVKITSFINAGSVKGEIVKELSDVATTANWTLESEAWGGTNKYPSCGCFYEQRLWLGGVPGFPETIWASMVGDYENFSVGVNDSDAIEFALVGKGQVSLIQWMEPRDYLIIGTTSSEWRVSSDDIGSTLTPTNVVAKQMTRIGSCDIQPITVMTSTLFVQRAGFKIQEFTYQWESDGYVAPDLTLLARSVFSDKIMGMVYQQEPYSIVWVWLTDGTLYGLSYMRDQNVIGWHSHPLTNGKVISMVVIHGDGYNELWAIIERTVNGVMVRYVEMMEAFFEDSATEYAENKGLHAFFVDSGITYNGESTTTITGLSHLEGQTVTILADGNFQGLRTVAGGQITLDTAASVVHVGLPYTATMETQRIEFLLKTGSVQGKLKKVHEITARVYRSGPFKAGRDDAHLDLIYDREREIVLGAPYNLYTGDLNLGFDDSWNTLARMTIVQDKPMPFTLLALMADIDV